MAGEAGKARTVLLATEKVFAADAVAKIQAVFDEAKYIMKRFEYYMSKDHLLSAVADVDAMIIRSDIVDAAVLEKAAKLYIVVCAGAGYDNIEPEACGANSITGMNTPGQNANAVAELVFGMMLTSARNNYDGTSGFEITGRSIAFYGYGAVAQAVGKLAAGFGMNLHAYDPYIPKDAIKSMGAEPVDTVADLHVPLTPETKESINKALLMKMPKGGALINTARQEVVHEAEMLEVLKDRPDFCYLCDVGFNKQDEAKAVVGHKYMKRVIITKKTMGAQTIEVNNNAGIAAANQIVGLFEKGVTKFSLKA